VKFTAVHDSSSRIPSSLCRYVSEECGERAVPTTSASMSVPSYGVVDDESPVCRICHCNDDNEFVSVDDDATTGRPSTATTTLITPCFCSGSLRFVHHYCLQQWIRSSNHKYCELCKFHFKLTVKSKPLLKVSAHWLRVLSSLNDCLSSLVAVSGHDFRRAAETGLQSRL
jgi:hypothetical protein